MVREKVSPYRDQRVLLLQGPVGPFFNRLAKDMKAAGATVFKIDFNGGDWLFSPQGSLRFTGTMKEWPAFFEATLDRLEIDRVFLYDDGRPLHQAAQEIARQRNVNISIFNEGQIGPDYVTVENDGSKNAMPRDPDFYRNMPVQAVPAMQPVSECFWHMASFAVMYDAASILLRQFFPQYQHHRPLDARQALPWIKSAIRKRRFKKLEAGIQERLTGPLSKKFFLVPLPEQSDAQRMNHSEWGSVENFIKISTAKPRRSGRG